MPSAAPAEGTVTLGEIAFPSTSSNAMMRTLIDGMAASDAAAVVAAGATTGALAGAAVTAPAVGGLTGVVGAIVIAGGTVASCDRSDSPECDASRRGTATKAALTLRVHEPERCCSCVINVFTTCPLSTR